VAPNGEWFISNVSQLEQNTNAGWVGFHDLHRSSVCCAIFLGLRHVRNSIGSDPIPTFRSSHAGSLRIVLANNAQRTLIATPMAHLHDMHA
jgi:hypothetical protein